MKVNVLKGKKLFILLCSVIVIVAIAGGIRSFASNGSDLKLEYKFTNSTKGSAAGTIELTATSSTTGTYSICWANDNGKLSEYKEITSIDANDESTKSYTVTSLNAIPENANKIVALKDDAVKAEYKINSNKLITDTKKFSFGALSDVHVEGGSDDSSKSKQDFENELSFFKSQNVAFVGTAGDITRDGKSEDIDAVVSRINNFGLPVYTARGNHDTRNACDSNWEKIEPNGICFEKVVNDEAFIFMGLNKEDYNNPFTSEQISQLKSMLEKYKGKRVFLFEHVFVGEVGNVNGLYPYSSLSDGGTAGEFKNLLKEYKNVISFTGHTHLDFNLQRLNEFANVKAPDDKYGFRVHCPSGSRPRRNDEGKSSSKTYTYDDGAYGYLVDVYDNYIILKGRDFVENKNIPYATYILVTNEAGMSQGETQDNSSSNSNANTDSQNNTEQNDTNKNSNTETPTGSEVQQNINADIKLEYKFTNNIKVNAAGTIELTVSSSNTGNYDIYWANDNGKLEDYEKITTIDANGTDTKSYKVAALNAIPKDANKIVAIKDDTVKAEYKINPSKLNNSSKKFSFGALSDIHLDGEGSDSANSKQDFENELNYFKSQNVKFVANSGDITKDGRKGDVEAVVKKISESGLSVYTARGNHDTKNACESMDEWLKIEPNGIIFEKEVNNEVFIFVGLSKYDYNNAFTSEQISQLKLMLEKYKGKRVFMFEHVFVGDVGNVNGLYAYNKLASSGTSGEFKNLLKENKNVILFTGHSHLDFKLQSLSDYANVQESGGDYGFRVHCPSASRPRENDEGKDSSKTYDNNEGALGYLVDVYDNYIVLTGRDFIANKNLPYATYVLVTNPSGMESSSTNDEVTQQTPPSSGLDNNKQGNETQATEQQNKQENNTQGSGQQTVNQQTQQSYNNTTSCSNNNTNSNTNTNANTNSNTSNNTNCSNGVNSANSSYTTTTTTAAQSQTSTVQNANNNASIIQAESITNQGATTESNTTNITCSQEQEVDSGILYTDDLNASTSSSSLEDTPTTSDQSELIIIIIIAVVSVVIVLGFYFRRRYLY